MGHSRAEKVRDLVLVTGAIIATSLTVVLSLPSAHADRPRPIALIFPPWTSAQDAVARSLAAGHAVLRSGASPFIVIAASQGEGGVASARPEGALLMLALDGLAGCLDAGTARDAFP